jgi:L-asparaginase II
MPVLAEVIRSGFTESRHRGSAVVLGADGRQIYAAGRVASPMFPRSSNKPMQAAAMVSCGLDLEGKLLALAAASHSGEDFHVTGVREILARAGLPEDALQCPPALPMDEPTLRRFLRDGGQPDRIHMNCSGKHAAMLATCVAAGWPTDSYRDPGHPLQRQIRQTVARLSGEKVSRTGVDGCGAPLFAVSLAGLARAFRAIVLAAPDSAERRVADAMRAYPDWASGTQRSDSALMNAVPGLLVKGGAEGVLAFALPDGRAAACKLEDGAARAVPAIAVALLRVLGAGGPHREGASAAGVAALGRIADVPAGVAALGRIADVPVYGGGEVVGHIRAVLPA